MLDDDLVLFVVLVAGGIALFLWGLKENITGIAWQRPGTVSGAPAHAIATLKMVGGVGFFILAAWLKRKQR